MTFTLVMPCVRFARRTTSHPLQCFNFLILQPLRLRFCRALSLAALLALVINGRTAQNAASTATGIRPSLDLDGVWEFATDPERSGEKEKWFEPQSTWPAMPRTGYAPTANGTIRVPGIWDNQGYGTETPKVRHNFVGLGWYRRTVRIPSDWTGRRVFLWIGGAHRYAKAWVNGHYLGEHIGYLSAFEFEVTDQVRTGQPATLVIQVDSQQRWEVDTMFGASDLADYMDVAWGGIWGHVRLEARAHVWLSELFLQPHVKTSSCTASARVHGDAGQAEAIRLEVWDSNGQKVTQKERRLEAPLVAGANVQITATIPEARLWSPDQPVRYRARLTLLQAGKPLDVIDDGFGMRELRLDGPFIILNGKRLFLRGYGDDHIYPEQMAMPTDKELFRQRLRLIKSYGFNHVRHHSTIMPPEYYDACDEIGIMPTAEFPIAYASYLPGAEQWKQHVPPGTDPGPAWETYQREWAAAIKRHRNHPSIFAWVMGNELWNGIPLRHEFQRLARELDPRRPFADTDGVTEMWQHILDPKNDRETLDVYFLMFDVGRNPLDLPDKFKTPRPIKPIISHETGNYVTFTRPDSAAAFRANIKPFWMTEGRTKLERLGLLDEAPQWAEASERLYGLLHKTNLEALRKNPFISGYHWWLFQDYWTTANGLVDHCFRPKSITADTVRRFNNEVVLLQDGLELTYRGEELMTVKLLVSNYSPGLLTDGRCAWSLRANDQAIAGDQLPGAHVGQGDVAQVGHLELTLPDVKEPTRLHLEVEWLDNSLKTSAASQKRWQNDWTTWLYPQSIAKPAIPVPLYGSAAQLKRWPELGLAPIPQTGELPKRAVYVMGHLNRRVLSTVEQGACLVLLQGGRVFNSRPLTFRSSWWKAGDDLNANLCGTRVYDYPITRAMAPDGWCDAGWFHLLEGGRKIILEQFPQRPQVIIRALPSLRAVEDDAILFEVGLGQGALLVSGLNHEQSRGRPENDWLLAQMMKHAATLPSPKVKWPLAALPLAERWHWTGRFPALRSWCAMTAKKASGIPFAKTM